MRAAALRLGFGGLLRGGHTLGRALGDERVDGGSSLGSIAS